MVKLGSLYRNNGCSRSCVGSQLRLDARNNPDPIALERLEFNQRIQERRMLQEEQKQWERLSPNHNELQVILQVKFN